MTVKSALQRDLDRFYKSVAGEDFSIREVSKSAFSQSRAGLNPDAFVELSDTLLDSFYESAPYLTFDGMRLLSGDGSRLPLPRHKSIVEEFGEVGYGPNGDSMRSQARCSFLYDVLNLTVLDARMDPISVGEETMLREQLVKVGPGDMLLLDRGYPSFWLFFLLSAKGVHFCVRMSGTWWLAIRKFAASGEKEQLVTFKLPKKDRELLKDYPEFIHKDLSFRLVCVELEDGSKEYLCTSLTDMERYPHEIFGEMYHMRWGVEEGFKLFKARVEVQSFTGKTATAVRQDFQAKVFAMNLCAVMAFPVEEKLREEGRQGRKHDRKVNRTSALALVSESIVAIFVKRLTTRALEAFDKIVHRTTEIVRPGRKNPRNHRKNQPPTTNYKRL